MDIALEDPDAKHFVKRYAPGELVLNTGAHTDSIIVYQDKVLSWEPRDITELTVGEISNLVALKPGMIILGTGQKQSFPESELLAAIYEARIGIEIMSTRAACQTYNLLADEGRDVLAALIIN